MIRAIPSGVDQKLRIPEEHLVFFNLLIGQPAERIVVDAADEEGSLDWSVRVNHAVPVEVEEQPLFIAYCCDAVVVLEVQRLNQSADHCLHLVQFVGNVLDVGVLVGLAY